MSAPAPQQSDQWNAFDTIGCLGVVTGAATGATWGAMQYGFWGAVIGFPVGLVAGAVAGWALMILFAVTVVPGLILFGYGPRRLWEFVCGRWEPPERLFPSRADQPSSTGE